jgi:YfiH family protein
VSPSWQLKSSAGVEYFELSPDPRLVLAFFTRNGGASHGQYESLNTSFAVGDNAQNVEENLARARRTLGLPAVITVKQTHSDTVLPIADERTPSDTLEGDACITDRVGIGLGLNVADCLPVYIYAENMSCVGIAHCGWRGTAARLAEETARQMSRRFHVPLSDLRFALGPCICPNCYVVGDDVLEEFRKSIPNSDRFFSPTEFGVRRSALGVLRLRLDLRAANRWLLTSLGLAETMSLELCTLETKNLCYSARRDKTAGRNLAVIALL